MAEEHADARIQTDIVVRHPAVQFYNFYDAYDGGLKYQPDIEAYKSGRRGILTQAAPNIGPL